MSLKMEKKNHNLYEPPFEAPGAGFFELKDREKALNAVKRFLSSYRRGLLLMSGLRGVGKTRLVREALEGDKGLKRKMPPSKNELPRKPLGVWVNIMSLDLASIVKIKKPGSADLENEPFDIQAKFLLMVIIQAIVVQLAPHMSFRLKGSGLRTKLGGWKFYFSIPRTYNKILASSKWLIFLLLGLIFIGLYSFLYLSFPYIKVYLLFPYINRLFPDALKMFEWGLENADFLKLAMSFIGASILFFSSWMLLRWREMALIRRNAQQLYLMTFSNNYKEIWGKSFESPRKSKRRESFFLKLFSDIFGTFFHKIKKLGVIAPDAPNLLYRLEVFLFQLHRIGIEPALIIDELDKLGSSNDLIRSRSGKTGKINSWVWGHRIKDERWTLNTEMVVFFDTILRFKESLGKKLPIILIGDMDISRFIRFSRFHNLAYHTLIKETVFIGQIKVEAWGKMLSELLNGKPPIKDAIYSKECPDMHKCFGANKREACCSENFKIDDEHGTLSCGGKVCQNFTKWRDYLWLRGMGCYGELLSLARSYRQSGWEENDDTLKWANDVVPYFKKHMFGAGQISGQNLPDEYSQSFRNIETSSCLFGIVYNLIQREPVFLPVTLSHSSSFIKAIHGTVWGFIESLEENGWVEGEKIKKEMYRSLGLKASDEAASYIKFFRVDRRSEE